MSRGLRNGNPLNLRRGESLWQGLRAEQTDPEFLQFRSTAWGYRAAFVTLRTYHRKYGASTLRLIIRRWAPPDDNNDTELYLRMVQTLSGLNPDRTLNPEDRTCMVPLVSAMSRVENGVEACRRDVLEGWALYMG